MKKKEFVAAGTYGCIFDSALKCKKGLANLPTNVVSKVFGSTSDFKEERDMETLIEEIDPRHEFTRPTYGTCQVNSGDINKYAINKCKHTPSQSKEYNQIVYKDGGNDLARLMKSGKSQDFINDILVPFTVIIDGIDTLSRKNYVHLDIKPENILYNKTRFFLIDFGLMSPKDEVYTHSHILRHNYPFYPPEFKMTVYKNDMNKFVKEFLLNFRYQYKVNSGKPYFTEVDLYYQIKYRVGYTIKEQEDDLSTLHNSIAQSHKEYSDKIDVYSIGMVLLLLYIWSDTYVPLLEVLIKSMIRFDPEARISTNDLKVEYRKILKR